MAPSRFGHLVLATLLLAASIRAQERDAPSIGTVECLLVDKADGRPVAGAPVQLDGAEPFFISDEKGVVRIVGVKAGPHEILILDPEHQPFRARFEVRPGKTVRLRYALDKTGSQEAEEVVVKAKRLKEELSDTVLKMEEVKKIPGTQGDVLRIVQSMPGVSRTPIVGGGAMAGVVVRGSAPEDSQVLIDGHPVPLLYHFGGIKSVLNADMLKRIDFLPGGFGAEFGEAIGGVIDVRTLPCTHRHFDGYVELSMLDAGFFLKGPLGKDAGFFAAARRSTLDAWLPTALEDLDVLELTVAPVYYDYQGKAEWSPTPQDRLSLLAYGSQDEMKWLFVKPISGDPSIRGEHAFRVYFHRVALHWTHVPEASDWHLKASAVGGFDAFDGTGGPFLARSRVPHLELRLDADWRLQNFTIAAGAFGRLAWYDLEYSLFRPPSEGSVPNSFSVFERIAGEEQGRAFAGGIYLSGSITPLTGMLITGGLRLDGFRFAGAGDWGLMPRLGFQHTLRPGTVFKAGVGLYLQAPPPGEISEGFGNPSLSMERAIHYTLGVEQALPLDIGLEMTVFYKDMDRLVVSDEEEVYTNAGIGKVSGLELLVRREMADRLFGWLAYTLMRSQRRDGPDEPWRLFSWDQTHILTAVAGYRLPTGERRPMHGLRSGWEFGLRFQLISGNPYTPIVGGVFDSDYDNYLPIPGPVNSRRLPLYHRLDLRVDYTWAFERWALGVFLDVENVYNHRAVWQVDYNYDYTETAYDRELPIIPALGIRGSF
jgi:hypothetical protein